ncbi:MAG TPA: dephospho-CoA kinase [Candidatus Dormibacteraeota bacterium]|nr:dephospho-CoA kinase [Candidatus Dormibacteraeota bacterium]
MSDVVDRGGVDRGGNGGGPGGPGAGGRRDNGGTVRIGITGPIGCGKSTVAGWLAELGAFVVDADRVSRDVTPPGSAALAAVVAEFGRGVVRADGSLDRAALGRIVFDDADALARLESIIHPAVRPLILAGIADAERAAAPGVVIEAIKLVEGGLADLCDEVWLLTCDPAEQRARLAGRGANPADSEARIAAQSDLAARLTPRATRILDTSGPRAAARHRVIAAWFAATGMPAPDPGA